MTIHELVERAAARYPDATAVSGSDATYSYAELQHRAGQVARHLVELGVRPDDLVGLHVGRTAAAFVGMLGILRAGAGYLCLDPTLPRDRLAFMADDARIAAAVTDSRSPRPAPVDCPVLDLAARRADAPGLEAPVTVTDRHAAYVMYTSGSTGQPKGVVVEHRSVVNLIRWQVRALGITAADRAAEVSSFTFDASILETWPYLASGASVTVVGDSVRPFPHAVRRWLVRNEVTTAWLTSPLAEQVMAQGLPAGARLRLLVTGGDRLTLRPPVDFPARVVNVYGPTETTVITTAGDVEPEGTATGLPTIGAPIDGVLVHLLDEDGTPVPDGEPGEIHIGGVGVSRGYLRRDALNLERFLPDPFAGDPTARMYRTGDIATRLPDGRLAFVGRRDDQVKVRGYRIELGEIEAVLAAHPTVTRAVVTVAGDRTDAHLSAYVQVDGGGHTDPAVLREYLGERLPHYMVPAVFHDVDGFPLTANGKIDRTQLPVPGILSAPGGPS